MIFTPTQLKEVFLVELERIEDERGFFARTWCAREFEAHGLNSQLAQCSISFNKRKGTLRGMHYQAVPHEETKVVRCIRGSVYDVALDLRPSSPTYLRWTAAELTARNGRALYIPAGCAHGFVTLEDDTEVLYQIGEFYHPDAGRGVRWNDPTFGIVWPEVEIVISERDATYPNHVRQQQL